MELKMIKIFVKIKNPVWFTQTGLDILKLQHIIISSLECKNENDDGVIDWT